MSNKILGFYENLMDHAATAVVGPEVANDIRHCYDVLVRLERPVFRNFEEDLEAINV